jgi:hypothetical protein
VQTAAVKRRKGFPHSCLDDDLIASGEQDADLVAAYFASGRIEQ